MSGSADALTLASAGVSLAKRITVIDGVITRADDPPWPRIGTFETIEVGTPDDLLDVLSSAADQDPAPCVVRGAPLAEIGRRAIYDDPEDGPAGLRAVPRTWVGYDLEKVPAGDIDPLREPERAVAKARRCLPPQHHDTTVVWQITATAGKRANELRLRLWFLVARPMLGRQIEAWCKPGIDSGWLDPCTLRNEVLPHFIAVKAVGNGPDPCPQRWGLIRGEHDSVPVPESMLVPEHRRDAVTVDGGDLDALGRRYGPDLDQLRRAAVAEIREEIAHVRAAGRGARHPAYMHAAARIEGLCAFWCIPLDKPRQLLERAYLSTLIPAESRKRERGSIRGVWSWLDRRAPR
jgi:hypothetical protein